MTPVARRRMTGTQQDHPVSVGQAPINPAAFPKMQASD